MIISDTIRLYDDEDFSEDYPTSRVLEAVAYTFGIDSDRLRAIAEAERMIGKTVYRITTPYRGVPKVTPYLVKNYRTTGKKHKIMFEVCAVGVGVMNVMSLKQFYLTLEAAEAALSAGKGE